jgi:hypothetical protein
METLKIGFTDTFDNAEKFFIWMLSQRYNIVRDDENPDYLVFGDGNFGNDHSRFQCKKIFFTGENVRPDYKECDYAVTFDHVNSPQHYRLPLYVLEMWAMMNDQWTDKFLYLVNKPINLEREWDKKKYFCSFVQSNGNVPQRNQFFHFLNGRSRVDSAGPWMNNVGYVLPRPGGHGDKIRFIDERKFNIAFENGSYPGYATEKLLNCFYANTIGIYWGSPTIIRDFNPKAFINCHEFGPMGDFKTYMDIWDRVRELMSDKNKYLDVLAQPAFVNDIPNEFTYINNFLNWWETFVK